jgi:hypothetical protein
MDDFDMDAAIARAEDARLEMLADWDGYEEEDDEEDE